MKKYRQGIKSFFFVLLIGLPLAVLAQDFPQRSTTVRNSTITAPIGGKVNYNTTTGFLEAYRNAAWRPLFQTSTGIEPSANIETLLGSSTYAAARTNLVVDRRIHANVLDYGAVSGDGNDDEDAFDSAAAALSTIGGGVVIVPEGTYDINGTVELVEGVEFKGAGSDRTIVRRHTSSTAHVFAATTDTTFDGGGITDLKIDGQSTTTYDAVNFELADIVDHFYIRDCRVIGVRRGYSGSKVVDGISDGGFDRYTTISNTVFEDCVDGVFMEEHVRVDHCTFNRMSGVAIKGRMTDCQVVNAKIWYSQQAIQHFTGAGPIELIGVEAYNCIVGFEIQSNVEVLGGKITGSASASGTAGNAASTHAVKLAGENISIAALGIIGTFSTGGYVQTGASFNDQLSIVGGHVDCIGAPGFVGAGGGNALDNATITGVTFDCRSGNEAFEFTNTLLRYCSISNCVIEHTAGTSTNLVNLPFAQNSNYNGNVHRVTGGTCTNGVAGGFTDCLLFGNIFNGFSTRISATLTTCTRADWDDANFRAWLAKTAPSGDVVGTTDTQTLTNKTIGTFDVGTAGVRITNDGDGAITFLGLGDGSDEDLTINLDDASNTVAFSSSTGVTSLTFNGMDLNVEDFAASSTITEGGNPVPNNTDKLSFFSATTSAELRGVLSDESGTGAAIFADGNIGAGSATTPSDADADTSIATTAFVMSNAQRARFLRPYAFVQGRYYDQGGYPLAGFSVAADALYLAPFVVGESWSPDTIGFVINTTGTATNVKFGVYAAPTGNNPNGATLVANGETANVAVGTTGTKTGAITCTLSPGFYWIGFVANGTIADISYAYVNPMSPMIGRVNPTDINGGTYYMSHAFGALPATITVGGSIANTPIVFLRDAP